MTRAMKGKDALRRLQLIKGWNHGASWEELAKAHGYPNAAAAMMSARRFSKALGLELRYGNVPKMDEEKKRLAYIEFEGGKSWAQISKDHGFQCAAAAKKIVLRWAYSSGFAGTISLPSRRHRAC